MVNPFTTGQQHPQHLGSSSRFIIAGVARSAACVDKDAFGTARGQSGVVTAPGGPGGDGVGRHPFDEDGLGSAEARQTTLFGGCSKARQTPQLNSTPYTDRPCRSIYYRQTS